MTINDEDTTKFIKLIILVIIWMQSSSSDSSLLWSSGCPYKLSEAFKSRSWNQLKNGDKHGSSSSWSKKLKSRTSTWWSWPIEPMSQVHARSWETHYMLGDYGKSLDCCAMSASCYGMTWSLLRHDSLEMQLPSYKKIQKTVHKNKRE